jgi:hypothetical protein
MHSLDDEWRHERSYAIAEVKALDPGLSKRAMRTQNAHRSAHVYDHFRKLHRHEDALEDNHVGSLVGEQCADSNQEVGCTHSPVEAEQLLYFESEDCAQYAANTFEHEGPLEVCWLAVHLVGFDGYQRSKAGSYKSHAHIRKSIDRRSDVEPVHFSYGLISGRLSQGIISFVSRLNIWNTGALANGPRDSETNPSAKGTPLDATSIVACLCLIDVNISFLWSQLERVVEAAHWHIVGVSQRVHVLVVAGRRLLGDLYGVHDVDGHILAAVLRNHHGVVVDGHSVQRCVEFRIVVFHSFSHGLANLRRDSQYCEDVKAQILSWNVAQEESVGSPSRITTDCERPAHSTNLANLVPLLRDVPDGECHQANGEKYESDGHFHLLGEYILLEARRSTEDCIVAQ